MLVLYGNDVVSAHILVQWEQTAKRELQSSKLRWSARDVNVAVGVLKPAALRHNGHVVPHRSERFAQLAVQVAVVANEKYAIFLSH
jgi:hypothetical protein